jgi:hypothetical protein
MALYGAYCVPNGTAIKLSTLIPSTVKKVDIKANPGNAATVYVGTSAVTTAGVNAFIALAKTESYGLSGEQLTLEAENLWVIATTTDKVHIAYVL